MSVGVARRRMAEYAGGDRIRRSVESARVRWEPRLATRTRREVSPLRMAADTETTPTDREAPGILPSVAAGEPGSVQACLDRFGGLVWSLARRLAHGDAEAEDAVQEIFLDIWKSAPRYDASVASETAFVAMIARRRLIDRRRRLSRRPEGQALLESTTAAPEPDVVDPVELSDDAARAAEALKKLSEEQQRVLKLSIYHGLSHEKIARATGLPLGTVKTHARRGLMKIRELLQADLEDAPSSQTPRGSSGDLGRGVSA